jgi:extradiol dioxygenase family protein
MCAMTRRSFCSALALSFTLSIPSPAVAQLAPPNDAGVTLGHIHLAVKDVEAQKTFWTTMLGGKAVSNGPLAMIQFPGILVMLRQADAPGAPAGTTVDHFGLVYRDIAAARARWKAAGVKFDIGDVNPNQGYVWSPNSEVRVEVFGDPSLPGEVSMDHVHMFPLQADIPAMQAWYAKVFGGFPGQRQRVARPGVIDVDYFGRFNLSFSAATTKPQPTRGHGIDHIGFDVKDIDAFAKRLEGMGSKFEAPPRQIPNASTRVAFFTDPWGTYIEVTEKLAPQQ